mmetsp:Transcript_45660/g.92170  ORF Transcript_45660/g.92170 Transcript_45660/m.92170 type:complete len:277 (-) Transcript_45660:331-1161(-)
MNDAWEAARFECEKLDFAFLGVEHLHCFQGQGAAQVHREKQHRAFCAVEDFLTHPPHGAPFLQVLLACHQLDRPTREVVGGRALPFSLPFAPFSFSSFSSSFPSFFTKLNLLPDGSGGGGGGGVVAVDVLPVHLVRQGLQGTTAAGPGLVHQHEPLHLIRVQHLTQKHAQEPFPRAQVNDGELLLWTLHAGRPHQVHNRGDDGRRLREFLHHFLALEQSAPQHGVAVEPPAPLDHRTRTPFKDVGIDLVIGRSTQLPLKPRHELCFTWIDRGSDCR